MSMSSERKRRRHENQILREQAMAWRQNDFCNQDYPIRNRNFKMEFEFEDSQSSNNNTKVGKSENIPNNNIWDEDGKLLGEKKTYPTVIDKKRKPSPKNEDKNLKQTNEKERFVTYVTKKEEHLDEPNTNEVTKKLPKSEVDEMTLRLSQVRKVKRQKSVRPKKHSTDFVGFCKRQNACAQARNQQYEPETYKIEISEGSKRYMNNEKFKKHSVQQPIKKANIDDDYEPVIQKQRSHHLQELDCTYEYARKEAKRIELAQKYEEEELAAFNKTKPRSASVKRKTAKPNPTDINGLKSRPDSIFNERKRIEHKITELHPIIEAEEQYPEKEKKRKKHTLPDYLKPIYESFKPLYDEKRKQRQNI